MCAIINEDGTILSRDYKTSPSKPSIKKIIKIIEESVEFITKDLDTPFDAIGVAIPGLADTKKGEWVYSPFSGLHNIFISDILRDIYKKPVFIENDVNACALAEKYFGKCKNVSDYIWVTISTGIGSGIVLNNKLFKGKFGFSGELGHVCVEYNPELAIRCGCGCTGCAEAMAAGPGIVSRYQKYCHSKEPSLTAKSIGDLAENGDLNAIKVFSETGIYAGRALASAVNLLNPEMIVLGGGVSLRYHLFAEDLWNSINNHIIHRGNNNLKITSTDLKYDASLYGAVAIIFDQN